MIGDYYKDNFGNRKWYDTVVNSPVVLPQPQISKEEFDSLKKEVMEMKELLRRAKIYDERNNEPDCEIEDKMEILRKIAALVGINLDDVLSKTAK